MKWLYITIAVGVICSGFGWLVNVYGDSRYREGRADAINASLSTDNQALIFGQKRMADAFDWVTNGTKDMVTDASPMAASTISAYERVCNARKAAGLRCTPPGSSDSKPR